MDYIKIARDFVDIEDLYHLLQRMVFSSESHGKVGCKGADLFLASQIANKTQDTSGFAPPPLIPRTWYVSSDMMIEFIHYNNMDEVIEQKYKDIERVRLEYPHVLEIFQQAVFPAEMISRLSAALDDFGDRPIIVRSSSLLEDRSDLAFVKKYRSVFLGNQGTREERLHDLMRAVAEIYASNFAPEPIEYRAEHGLLEFSEQMGIMIQEVVGTRVGPYFLPAYSGIALSRNDFQWPAERRGNGGIIHIIPGLGTGAARWARDEHPVPIIPGQPSEGVDGPAGGNISHTPRTIDVMNLETNSIQTLDVNEFIENFGDRYPCHELVLSVHENGKIRPPDPGREKRKPVKGAFAVTFDGLVNRSPFVLQVKNLLRTLEESLGMPVEVEFASDGENLYLLQCRPQSLPGTTRPPAIPDNIPREKLIFSAGSCVSNRYTSGITHAVYVDPEAHAALRGQKHHKAVLDALGELNRMLPARQFLLLCAVRWSDLDRDQRGIDMKRCDFGNAAAIIELAGPDPSRTGSTPMDVHFLRDIQESGTIYLPIFPGDEDTFLNRQFFTDSRNILPELLPEYTHLTDVIRVVDLPGTADGKSMQVILNAYLDRAVGFLADPGQQFTAPAERELLEETYPENYWHWRYHMAERIAGQINPEKSGVVGVYLFGSTKNGTAGPASSIDILIHFKGSDVQRDELVRWLEGWSLCLDEINYLRTGYRSGGLLNYQIVTDDDIANRTSYAVKINAVTDAARPLRLKEKGSQARRIIP